MKPNLIVVQPPNTGTDSIIEQFCEKLAEAHYVYLIRPIAAPREDSPAGVRFLNFYPDRFPQFGVLDNVIVIDESSLSQRLRDIYPDSHHTFWDFANNGQYPDTSALGSRIVHGDFGHAELSPLARAM